MTGASSVAEESAAPQRPISRWQRFVRWVLVVNEFSEHGILMARSRQPARPRIKLILSMTFVAASSFGMSFWVRDVACLLLFPIAIQGIDPLHKSLFKRRRPVLFDLHLTPMGPGAWVAAQVRWAQWSTAWMWLPWCAGLLLASPFTESRHLGTSDFVTLLIVSGVAAWTDVALMIAGSVLPLRSLGLWAAGVVVLGSLGTAVGLAFGNPLDLPCTGLLWLFLLGRIPLYPWLWHTLPARVDAWVAARIRERDDPASHPWWGRAVN